MKNKVLTFTLFMLSVFACPAAEPNLQETLAWLKQTIEQSAGVRYIDKDGYEHHIEYRVSWRGEAVTIERFGGVGHPGVMAYSNDLKARLVYTFKLTDIRPHPTGIVATEEEEECDLRISCGADGVQVAQHRRTLLGGPSRYARDDFRLIMEDWEVARKIGTALRYASNLALAGPKEESF